MKLGPIVLKLRLANTRFGNLIGGAAELSIAMTYTLKKEMAFVIPLKEDVPPNQYDSGISQLITEKFAVVVALDNSVSDKEKTGLVAYDLVHEVRAEILKGILGWQITGAESLVYYAGGRLLDVTNAYLWYQYEFEYTTRIDNDDGVDSGVEDLDWFDEIYAQWVLAPSDDLPVENLPITAFSVDMTSLIDFTEVEYESEYDDRYEVNPGGGLKLEPDVSPYTGTTLIALPELIDDIEDAKAGGGNWATHFSYGLDFGSAQRINRIICWSVHSGGDLTEWYSSDYDSVKVFGSDDNTAWTEIEQFDAPTCYSHTEGIFAFILEFTCIHNYRYFKVVNIDSFLALVGGHVLTISEMKGEFKDPESDAFEFDDASTPDTIDPDSSIICYVTGGNCIYTWAVQGAGYSFDSEITEGKQNVLRCIGGVCGVDYDTYATITITDGNGNTVEATIKNTAGAWVLKDQGDNAGDTFYTCGEGNEICAIAPNVEYIVGIKRWVISIHYTRYCDRGQNNNYWKSQLSPENYPPCGNPWDCAKLQESCGYHEGSETTCYCPLGTCYYYEWDCP